MAQPISPALITQSQFESYTKAWSDLLDDKSPAATKALQTLFTAGGQLTNYVYLDHGHLLSLLSSVGTKRICVRLAVVPSPAILLAISLVIYGVDQSGKQTSGYYMAGTRGAAAKVEQVISVTDSNSDNSTMPVVSFIQVSNWVTGWQSKVPADMTKEWFKTVYGNLRGYTYRLKDFWDAMLTTSQLADNQELWLSYILHDYVMPGEVDTSSLFGLVLTLNSAQDNNNGNYKFVLSNDGYYYDVSRPCPPICG